MGSDTTNTKTGSGDEMGISFNDIHSDEPHEAVTPQNVETGPLKNTPDKPPSLLTNQGHLFNVTKAFEGGHVEAGTIVSDKKRSRPGFIENLQSAVHEWWGTTKRALENTVEEIPRPVKEEKPVVAKVETRVEVVKKAAEKSTLAPKDDHKVVIEKIRTFKQDVARVTGSPITLKEPDHLEPAWKNETKTSTSPISIISKVDLRHATIAPHVQRKVEVEKIVPSSKGDSRIPVPPPPKITSATSLTSVPTISKTASAFVPPTHIKKVFTPPASSVTAAPRVQPEKKIVSVPIAPAWQTVVTDAPLTPEKPHMYTKKDFEKAETLSVKKPDPVQKPPLKSLKPQDTEVGAPRQMIHESFVVPTYSATPSVPLEVKQNLPQIPKVQSVAPAESERQKVSTPVPAIKPPVPAPAPSSKPVIPTPTWSSSKEAEVVPQKQSPFATSRSSVPQRPEPIRVEEKPVIATPAPRPQTPPPTSDTVEKNIATPVKTPAFHSVAATIPHEEPAPLSQTVTAPIQPQQPAALVPSLIQNPVVRRMIKWAVLGCIAIIGVTLAVVLSIYFNVFAPNSETQPTILTIPSFFNTESQTSVPLEGTPALFLTTLADSVTQSTGVKQLYPIQKEVEGFSIATAPEVFAFLGTNLGQKTIRALDDTMMIGSITTTKNEPFIILRSYNFDTLFAGFLAWEPYMYEDLAPLFGTEPIADIRFKDAVRGNASTRILYNGAGNEVMLYSFINQNTVVITTSGEALAHIIEQF